MANNKIITRLIFLMIAMSNIGCEKEYPFTFRDEKSKIVVVEGMITSENRKQTVRLTYARTNPNSEELPISGANVLVTDGFNSWQFTENTEVSGLYESDPTLFAVSGRDYTLIITTGGQVYSAKAKMTKGSDFKLLRYTLDTEDSLYYISWVANPYNPDKPAMYEVLLDWSQVPGYFPTASNPCKARLYYYSLPTLDANQVFAPNQEKVGFPKGTRIIEKRYSISPEYAEFLRAMLSETAWNGGFFDSDKANVPTNISNGAMGFFTVCDVRSRFWIVGL